MCSRDLVESSVLDRRKFYRAKFELNVKAQSAHKVIPVLRIKSEEGLIAHLPITSRTLGDSWQYLLILLVVVTAVQDIELLNYVLCKF